MNSTLQQEDNRLPAWAKAVIVFVIVSFLALYLGGIGLICLSKKAFQQAIDPIQAAKIAQEIAKFPQPLPAGFTYNFAVHFGPVKIVTLKHQPDKQEITIVSAKQVEPVDAQTLLQQAYEQGINIPSSGLPSYAYFQSPKSHGELEIANEKMPYFVGELKDNSGGVAEGFVGCIVLKSMQKSILVFGLQPPGGHYNLDETVSLLKSLSGF